MNDGYHFYLEHKCPLCAERSAVVATFRKKIAQLINSYIKWTNLPKNGSSPTAGFIARPTWITTYFHKKRIDLSYAQKTALACIKRYRDLKTSRDTRVLPLDKFQIELNEGLLDVLRNLIPPLHTEEQFCGLIKGTYIFLLMYYLDDLHHFRHLDPSNNFSFSFSALQKEFRVVAKTLTYEEKKGVLSFSILLVDAAYQSLTLQSLPVPKWVNSFREFISRLFPHFRTES